MRISFLPKDLLQNVKETVIINSKSYIIDTSNNIYEIAEIDRPHSSWFVGDECVQRGSTLICMKTNPVFLLLDWISNKGKKMFLSDDLFKNDDEFEKIRYILIGCIDSVCDYIDVGDGPLYFFSEKKTKEFILNKINKLIEHDKVEQQDENIRIESAFDIMKHYIQKDVEVMIKDELKSKYPNAFKPKKLEIIKDLNH